MGKDEVLDVFDQPPAPHEHPRVTGAVAAALCSGTLRWGKPVMVSFQTARDGESSWRHHDFFLDEDQARLLLSQLERALSTAGQQFYRETAPPARRS